MRRSAAVAAGVSTSILLTSCTSKLVARPAGADPLLFIEASDTLGLPLPDTRLELFDRAAGGLNPEWLSIAPEMLEEGIHLLRFSHPGYKSSTFSVPLREGGLVTLRVRLTPDSGHVTPQTGRPVARHVRAIGISRRGSEMTDIIDDRLVLDRDEIERADATSIAETLRQALETGLIVEDTPGGLHTIRRQSVQSQRCPIQVMINGDATLVISFLRFEELYRNSEAEAIEIVPNPKTLPYYFRRSDSSCGFLLIWLTGREHG